LSQRKSLFQIAGKKKLATDLLSMASFLNKSFRMADSTAFIIFGSGRLLSIAPVGFLLLGGF
jgi:hypothetical protein